MESSRRDGDAEMAQVHAQKTDFWTSFTANWVVPELPAEDNGQTVYATAERKSRPFGLA